MKFFEFPRKLVDGPYRGTKDNRESSRPDYNQKAEIENDILVMVHCNKVVVEHGHSCITECGYSQEKRSPHGRNSASIERFFVSLRLVYSKRDNESPYTRT
eukprot:TRINITY_DN9446_c0_g1_i1.p2 TRINITY_DN9446_c0_g1~~TRINITY_DN9446_c0_g1_i1.p2  ORF type:complete len:101 (-),score=5.34 TRINITY_DN9446_c0_g1_i1:62-364(-)